MNQTKNQLPLEIYFEKLQTIGGIPFSPRQIDIMACILKGRKTSKIADLLSIEPKTIETHIRKITEKFTHRRGSSRESIIDFIEKSHEYQSLQDYYSALLIQYEFEKLLHKISLHAAGKNFTYTLSIDTIQKKSGLLTTLEKHLDLLNLKKKEIHLIDNISDLKITWDLVTESHLLPVNSFSFNCEQDYYKAFFNFCKKIFPNVDTSKIYDEFELLRSKLIKVKSERDLSQGPEITDTYKDVPHQLENKELNHKQRHNSLKHSIIGGICFLILCSAGLIFYFYDRNHVSIIAHSELPIPNENILLHRSLVLNEMQNKLKPQSGIKSIALIGPGGSGKTTVARHFARTDSSSITWEIDSQTTQSIVLSLEELANKIVQTKSDQKALKEIEEKQDPQKHIMQLLDFLKKKLREHPNWILIFDNVEKFSDILPFFPSNSQLWGNGLVIITARMLHQNNFVKSFLLIKELDSKEKSKLFMSIIRDDKTPLTHKETDLTRFLENLPSYPLDVSLAAFYLKTTNISLSDYISKINTFKLNNNYEYNDIGKNSINYSKTRFQIITNSLTDLIKYQKDFEDILLFICLVDFQNIPLDLLNILNNKSDFDNFVYHLKKYYLITNFSDHPKYGPIISLHKSTQESILAYLQNSLDFQKKLYAMPRILEAFENQFQDIINNESFSKLNLIEAHVKKFLMHEQYLSPTVIGSLESELGCIYYFQDKYQEALEILNKSLIHLSENKEYNGIRKARTLSHIGKVYRDKGEYKNAIKYFEESKCCYENSPKHDSLELSRVLAYLGSSYSELENYAQGKDSLEKALTLYQENPTSPLLKAWILLHLAYIERQQGNYEKAIKIYEESLRIYETSQNHVRTYRVYGSLGCVNYKLGYFLKAKKIIEEGLNKYTKNISDSDINAAGLMLHLGNVYNKIQEFDKAKDILENSLEIHRILLGRNNLRALGAQGQLGVVLAELGKKNEGISLIEEALKAYEKYYGADHIENVDLLMNLGRAHLLSGRFSTAEVMFQKALKIYEGKQHPDAFLAYELLSDLFKNKAKQAYESKKIKAAEDYDHESRNYLSICLKLLDSRYSNNNPHILRIKKKLNTSN